jgi:ubiquinone/menaquinone biosynthesis C-methylase UbiE
MRTERKIEEKNPILEAIRNNQWYIADQLMAAREDQSRSINRRYNFIQRSIKDYLKYHNEKPIRILDAGCGDGVQLQVLVQIPELEVWGVDYNPVRTDRAKQNFPGVNLICCSLLSLPFCPAFFNIILCSQVIEHIPQDDQLLEQLANVLKPQGLLILGMPNEGCFMARLRNYVFERNILKTTDHVHFYTEIIIRQKLKATGFIIQQIIRENWFFPHQLINYYLQNRDWGFRLMGWLNKIIPSQTAGYYFKCVKCQ